MAEAFRVELRTANGSHTKRVVLHGRPFAGDALQIPMPSGDRMVRIVDVGYSMITKSWIAWIVGASDDDKPPHGFEQVGKPSAQAPPLTVKEIRLARKDKA